MRTPICLCGALLAVCGAFAGTASAELNLWISYQFMGQDAYDAGDYKQAETVLQAALAESQKKFRRAETLDSLGRVYTSQGRFEEAEKAFQEALNLFESSLGRRHRVVAETLNNLADLRYIWQQGEVESLYRRALDINEDDQLNVEVARSLNGMALLHNDAGDVVEAEKLLKRAIQINERGERRSEPYTATTLVNLGILYTNLGRYSEAQPLLKRAEYIQSATLRPDHPDIAVRKHAQAALLQATGMMAEGAKLAAEAEAIREKQAMVGNAW
ncbi:MAG: tetratricopeptide repeat protein [Candidatus Hydrogenedentes bacterium]|nr:tetratricopeptide repeat protein [Candidatus Hydrogenedentota bacterium]